MFFKLFVRGHFQGFYYFDFRTEIDFELACNETLESLCDYLEQIVEDSPKLDNPDITFSVCTSILVKVHSIK